MTHISSFKTKKQLKEAVKEGKTVYLQDPSIINPVSGSLEQILEQKPDITCTNHPKRSWYARIYRNKKTGKIVVQ